MTERLTKTVTVVEVEEFDRGWPPTDGLGLVVWFSDHLKSVPLDYRETTRIEIVGETRYDQSLATITITYTRPETDEELHSRLDFANRNALHRARAEQTEFERLWVKFGGKPPGATS